MNATLFDRTFLRKLGAALRHPSVLARLVKRVVCNLRLDLKYGGYLGALSGELKSGHKLEGAVNVANTDATILPHLFHDVEIQKHDVLVDVGCGKGRVINWWLDQGLTNQIIGVEIDEEVSNRTRNRLARFSNVRIITGNILDQFPAEGTLFYLFHPFSLETMNSFKKLIQACNHLRLIYFNGVHVQVFERDSFWRVSPIALPNSIFVEKPNAFLVEKATSGRSPNQSSPLTLDGSALV